MPGATNPRGIPTAPFIDRVEDYVSNRSQVEGVLKNFQEMISYVCLFANVNVTFYPKTLSTTAISRT